MFTKCKQRDHVVKKAAFMVPAKHDLLEFL